MGMEWGKAHVLYLLPSCVFLVRCSLRAHRLQRQECSFVAFRNVSKDDANVILVDCSQPGVSSLTHHRTAKTPGDLFGDSSTELVIDARRKGHMILKGKTRVSVNHFDIDGFLSVLAATRSDLVNQYGELFIQAAKIGDFREFDFDKFLKGEKVVKQALALCTLLNTLERCKFSKPFEGDDDRKWPIFLAEQEVYDAIAGAVPKTGMEEYEEVLRGCKILRDPSVTTITRYEDVGLVVIDTPNPLHYYALFSVCGAADIVLTKYSSNRYEVEQRYTTYVEYQSRPTFPRICMSNLARFLQANSSQGDCIWRTDRFVDSGPLLRLEKASTPNLTKAQRYGHPSERPIYSSALSPTEIENVVYSYFKHAYSSTNTTQGDSKEWSFQRMHALNAQVDWTTWADANKIR
uniref:Uncharacterized protein n=1 Tax=Mucochytrium quahogii TaxID=96639 RepID=A0A7S2RZN1_9STRA|mmetsp:Transcript_13176/g.21390  ORF Transcript_13176/g.21390 Transcript_13176/m.21390 type:complete len:405 (+) Transcript_13176:139-1353(+)